MRYYQLTYLLFPDISEEELQSFPQKVLELLNQGGGKIENSSLPRKKKLGYLIASRTLDISGGVSPAIKKRGEAYFGVLDFYLDKEKLLEFEKKFKEQKEILRYLLIKREVPKTLPEKTFALRKKEEITKKEEPSVSKTETEKSKKVGLKEIEEKLEEILGE